jgi:Spy/CpxP family protein refolding chaperone
VKRDWLVYLVIFSLALNLGTIGTFAYLRYQDQLQKVAPAGPPPPMHPHVLWLELRLNNAQRQAMRAMFPEHRRKVAAVRYELAKKRQELFGLIKGDAPPDAIRAKIREISNLQGNLEEEMLRFMLALKKNLNPRQRAAFLAKLQMRLCGPAACGPMRPGFRRHRRPGMRPGMGPGMVPGMHPREGPPMEFPTK